MVAIAHQNPKSPKLNISVGQPRSGVGAACCDFEFSVTPARAATLVYGWSPSMSITKAWGV